MEALEGVKLIVVHELDGSKELVTANVGDARVILVRGGQAIQLTVDHKVSRAIFSSVEVVSPWM